MEELLLIQLGQGSLAYSSSLNVYLIVDTFVLPGNLLALPGEDSINSLDYDLLTDKRDTTIGQPQFPISK